MRLLLKILNYAFTTLLVLIIAASAFLALSTRASKDRVPTLAGRKVLTVLSGSMEPAIHTGDVIVVRPLAQGELPKEGDVITFRAGPENQMKDDMLITHRVMGIVLINDKPSAWVTKGDANDSQDLTPVSLPQIVGTYSWRVPYFGYVVNFLRTPLGVVLLLVIPGVVLIAGEIRKIYQILMEAEAAKAKAKTAEAGPPGGDSGPS